VDWPALYAASDLARVNAQRCGQLVEAGVSGQQQPLAVEGTYAQPFGRQVGGSCCINARKRLP
jgi:hypothetical protein